MATVAAAASHHVTSEPSRQRRWKREHGWRRQRRRVPVASLIRPPHAFGNPLGSNTTDKEVTNGAAAQPGEPDEPLPAHFDLDTSILLAGFAFESYLSPEGGLLDTDVRGGSTAYLSPFVREVFAGVVEVTVVKCDNLAKGDAFGKSDPYCILGMGGASSYRTKTKRSTLNPKWSAEEATARLYVRRDPLRQVLTIRVLDEDLFESDDLLGVVHVPLEDLVDRALARSPLGKVFAQTEERTLGLPAGSGAPGGGAVTIKMRFVPFNPPAAEVVSRGLRRASVVLGKTASGADSDARLKLAVKAAGAAADAMAGGLDYISKEAARREFEDALWAVKPEGDWAVLASQKGLTVRGRDATPHRFEKVCFVENADTDTQAAVWRCAPDKTVVVSFRGTEMNKVRDVVTDANLTPSSFNPERVSGGSRGGGRVIGSEDDEAEAEGGGGGSVHATKARAMAKAKAKGKEKGKGDSMQCAEGEEEAMVHGGFLSAYDSVRARVFAAVDDIMACTPADGGSSGDEDKRTLSASAGGGGGGGGHGTSS